MLVNPARRAASGDMMTWSGSMAAADASRRARRPPTLARFPPVERGIERVAGGREHAPVQQPHAAEVQHDFRRAAGHEHLRCREAARSVRQRVHQARRRPIDPGSSPRPWAASARGGGDRRDVQQQIRGAAERGMDEHRVLDGGSW